MPQFVILHHTGCGGEHWDLMLEHGDGLRTWQLAANPAAAPVFPIAAKRIGDHRKRYLDYEGPISGDRGEVARVDRGALVLSCHQPHCVAGTLHGDRLSGPFELRQDATGWEFFLRPLRNERP